MSETVVKEETHPLIEHLMGLYARGDRGPLAELRRGAGQYPDYGERVLRHVVRFFPAKESRNQENALLMVATLFALHPTERDSDEDIGAVLRRIHIAKLPSDCTERRFLMLLGCSPDELATHLRHVVSLAAAAGLAIGWSVLLHDVEDLLSKQEWRRQRVVRKWSRSFWSSKPQTPEKSEDSQEPNTSTNPNSETES